MRSWPQWQEAVRETMDGSASRPEKAGQGGRLLDPRRHLRFVEIVLVDVDPARVLAGAAAWSGSQRPAAEEGHLHVAGENVERQEPTPALDAVERRVPLHGLAHVRHAAHDEPVEALPEV